MLQDLRIEKEDLQALLAEMEKRGFVATTLHEIRTFTMAQRRTPLALDECPSCDGEGTGFSEGESWTCSVRDGTGIRQ